MKIVPFQQQPDEDNEKKISVLKELIALAEANQLGDIAMVYENNEEDRPVSFQVATRYFTAFAGGVLLNGSTQYEEY